MRRLVLALPLLTVALLAPVGGAWATDCTATPDDPACATTVPDPTATPTADPSATTAPDPTATPTADPSATTTTDPTVTPTDTTTTDPSADHPLTRDEATALTTQLQGTVTDSTDRLDMTLGVGMGVAALLGSTYLVYSFRKATL